jgi:hypothetical protein
VIARADSTLACKRWRGRRCCWRYTAQILKNIRPV